MWASSDSVRIVLFDTEGEALPSSLLAALDEAERERADRFVFDEHRRRFLIAHAVTRVLLGRCMDLPPAAIRYRPSPLP